MAVMVVCHGSIECPPCECISMMVPFPQHLSPNGRHVLNGAIRRHTLTAVPLRGDTCPVDAVPFPPAVGAILMLLSERQKKSRSEGRPKNVVLFVFLLFRSRCGGAILSAPQKSEDSYVNLNFRPTWPEVLRCKKVPKLGTFSISSRQVVGRFR